MCCNGRHYSCLPARPRLLAGSEEFQGCTGRRGCGPDGRHRGARRRQRAGRLRPAAPGGARRPAPSLARAIGGAAGRRPGRPGRRHRRHGVRPAQVTRVAAVDLGTNTTRLLVADVENRKLEEVALRVTITRLGEGVDARRRLLPLPITRVRNVLADYRRELESLGAERVLAVATSAIRDAENGEAFLGEVAWSYGFTTRLLSGEEEAALTLRGLGEVDEETLVLDVGGGSTEFITRSRAASVDIGSVRLTEQFGEDVD